MTRTELLFASWAVRALKDARGARWRKLVEEVAALPETDPAALAFQLMMVRLNGCISCDARRFAERGGCANCSVTNLTFSKESEAALMERYRAARKEIAEALDKPSERTRPMAGAGKSALSRAA